MGNVIDLTGRTFGRLTVIEQAPIRPTHWKCRCACGTVVNVLSLLLRDGRTKSCGCLRRETTAARSRTHGHGGGGSHRAPEYRVWLRIKQCCTNPKNPGWADYGGRGIAVCERWSQSFAAFYADMGPRPAVARGRLRDYSIERADNDGPYSPENCRWATYAVQSRNKRSNRVITFRGDARTVQDWEAHTGLQVRQRLNAGWSIERALTTPAVHHNGRHR